MKLPAELEFCRSFRSFLRAKKKPASTLVDAPCVLFPPQWSSRAVRPTLQVRNPRGSSMFKAMLTPTCTCSDLQSQAWPLVCRLSLSTMPASAHVNVTGVVVPDFPRCRLVGCTPRPTVAPGLVGLPQPEGVLRTPSSVPPATSPDDNTDAFLNWVVGAADNDLAGHDVLASMLHLLEALRDRQRMYDVCAARPENRRLAALSTDAERYRRRLDREWRQSLHPPKETWLFQQAEQNSARRDIARVKRLHRREKTRKRSVWTRLCEERGLLRLEREIVSNAAAADARRAQLERAAAAADARRALKHALKVDAVASAISLLALGWHEIAILRWQPWGKRPAGSGGVARTTSGAPDTVPGLCGGCQSAAQHRCSGCHAQWYCSPGHQRDHWKVHRTECERLQARHGCALASAASAAVEVTMDDDVVEIGDDDADWGFLADEQGCICCSKAVASAATEAPLMAAAAAPSLRHRAALDTSSSPATGVSAQSHCLLLFAQARRCIAPGVFVFAELVPSPTDDAACWPRGGGDCPASESRVAPVSICAIARSPARAKMDG